MNLFPNWAKNILFLLVYMLSGLTLVIIIDGLLSGTELMPLNTLIEQAVVHLRGPIMTNVFLWITYIGSPFTLTSIAIILAILLVFEKDHYNAALFLIAMAISILSFTVLKDTFQIARPGSDLSFTGWSFPSGHSTVATAFFFTLAHTFFNRMRTLKMKTFLVLGSIIGGLLICLSRLYLGAHWALDVLAGIALGILSVSFTVLIFSVFIDDRLLKSSARNR